ncbi:hypothetical protein HK104_002051 [Borealophlyctis nickersoniae]|nr:hypothetical protein HK104_002051 [Borealophlyctis nickersoniae]
MKNILKDVKETPPQEQDLDEEDEFLLKAPEARKPTTNQPPARIRPKVSWLRNTEYIASDDRGYGSPVSEANNAAFVRFLRARKVEKPPIDMSPEGQIRAIEATFEAAGSINLQTLKHPKKPDVTPVELWPIFPNFLLWNNHYMLVTYDGDPTELSLEKAKEVDPGKNAQLEEAILKPMTGDDGVENICYFTPTTETLSKITEKRKRVEEFGDDEDDDDDETYEYSYVRDFIYDPKPKNDQMLYLELGRNGGALYGRFHNQLKMRRKRAPRRSEKIAQQNPATLLLKKRPETQEERAMKRQKFKETFEETFEDDVDEDGEASGEEAMERGEQLGEQEPNMAAFAGDD